MEAHRNYDNSLYKKFITIITMSKTNFYIKNRERLLENVDDENNVSTAEEILTDYNERMEPKRKRTTMAII